MNIKRFHAFALAGLISLLAPFGQFAKADAAATGAQAPKLTEQVQKQTEEKMALRDRLNSIPSAGAARIGETPDRNQVSVKQATEQGMLKLDAQTLGGFAYVQEYQEPDGYAYRNYCGPGAATIVISHWDPTYTGKHDIDKLGEDMNMDPNGGVWVRDMLKPINNRINAATGQELNWYRYGDANSLEDFRWMLNVDILQNGVPLVTSLMTKGLPGWGGQDVGHIVAVYGYTRDANGTEYVTYADTAGDSSGYQGHLFHTVELGTFWNAVNQNSAQIW